MIDHEETEVEALARHQADNAADVVRYVIESETHPPTAECPDAECDVCAFRDCPHRETLHYHHDGCPACDAPPTPRTDLNRSLSAIWGPT